MRCDIAQLRSGSRIAFVGAVGITLVKPDGSGGVVLPPGLHPSWSPDGKSLTFTRVDAQSSIGRIYVMDADGTNLRALTSTQYPVDDQQPDWQPVPGKPAAKRPVREADQGRGLGEPGGFPS